MGPGKVNISDFADKKAKGEKITMLTAYDYPTGRMVDSAGVDAVLVGDSLGMVVLGYETTREVTMDDMIHHARAAKKGVSRAFLVGDMPYMSCEPSDEAAVRRRPCICSGRGRCRRQPRSAAWPSRPCGCYGAYGTQWRSGAGSDRTPSSGHRLHGRAHARDGWADRGAPIARAAGWTRTRLCCHHRLRVATRAVVLHRVGIR